MRLPWHGGTEINVLGIPYEGPITGRPGSSEAPAWIRRASSLIESYSPETGVDVAGIVNDVGDVYPAHNVEQALDEIEDAARGLKRLVVLGGSHVVTLGVVRAVKPKTIVYLDAHWDLRDEYMGERLSHACVARRLVEEGYNVVFYGVRSGSREEWEIGARMRMYDVNDAWEPPKGDVYVSVDVDVLDPAFAPGVGTPEPGGVDVNKVLSLIHALRGRIVAADIVEVNPLVEHHVTPVVAAKILREIIASMVRP